MNGFMSLHLKEWKVALPVTLEDCPRPYVVSTGPYHLGGSFRYRPPPLQSTFTFAGGSNTWQLQIAHILSFRALKLRQWLSTNSKALKCIFSSLREVHSANMQKSITDSCGGFLNEEHIHQVGSVMTISGFQVFVLLAGFVFDKTENWQWVRGCK